MSEKKTAAITIAIEPGKKSRMEDFFEDLGLYLSAGVSVFFEKCIMEAALPAEVIHSDEQKEIEDWEDGLRTEQIIVPITAYKKGQVEYTLREAGMTADEAVGLYFEACLHEWGIPFRVGYPKPNAETLAAMAEEDSVCYGNVQGLLMDLEDGQEEIAE